MYPPDPLLPNSRTQALKRMLLIQDVLNLGMSMQIEIIEHQAVKKPTLREWWTLLLHRLFI